MTLRQLALAHAAEVQPVTWRQGTKATRDNPAAADGQLLPGHPGPPGKPAPSPGRQTAACPPAGCWLNGRPGPRSPPATGCPRCPQDTPLEELVRLAKIRWRVEHDYRELKTGLGLDHFEGRSFAGGTASHPRRPGSGLLHHAPV